LSDQDKLDPRFLELFLAIEAEIKIPAQMVAKRWGKKVGWGGGGRRGEELNFTTKSLWMHPYCTQNPVGAVLKM